MIFMSEEILLNWLLFVMILLLYLLQILYRPTTLCNAGLIRVAVIRDKLSADCVTEAQSLGRGLHSGVGVFRLR